jgi:hypothetical protein
MLRAEGGLLKIRSCPYDSIADSMADSIALVLYLTCVSFVHFKVIASLQLTRVKATDRARPVTSQRFGALHHRRPRACPATGGLAPPRRNRFGGLPRDLATKAFAVGTFSVVGPWPSTAQTSVRARRCSAPNLLRNVGTRPSFASQVNHIQIRNKNNMSKCHVNNEFLAAQGGE